MNTDRLIYLATAIIAVAVAIAITAFASWAPLDAPPGASHEQDSARQVAYRPASETPAHAPARM